MGKQLSTLAPLLTKMPPPMSLTVPLGDISSSWALNSRCALIGTEWFSFCPGHCACVSLPGLVFAFLAALLCSGITLCAANSDVAIFWEGRCLS